MAQIKLIEGLPFVSATLEVNAQAIELEYVLIDTGAGACIFRTDDLERLGVKQQLTDKVRRMTGIGGDEYVVEKQIDKLSVGQLVVQQFAVQAGALAYGMRIDGIIGTDFLLQTGARIDFANLTIT